MQMATPLDLLEKNINQTVFVILKPGMWVRGILRSYDKYLNLVLDECEEIIHDPETEKTDTRRLGSLIVRGDNVVSITPVKQ